MPWLCSYPTPGWRRKGESKKEALAGWEVSTVWNLSGSLTRKIRLLSGKPSKMLQNQAYLWNIKATTDSQCGAEWRNRGAHDINKDGNRDSVSHSTSFWCWEKQGPISSEAKHANKISPIKTYTYTRAHTHIRTARWPSTKTQMQTHRHTHRQAFA